MRILDKNFRVTDSIRSTPNVNALPTEKALVEFSNYKSVFAAGTVYALTATSAAVDFGTTDPSITLDKPGTYLLIARAKLNYKAATFAASRTTTMKLRRTNNTAGDVTNGAATASTDIITTLTYTMIDQTWQTIYTTANSDDVIAIFGHVSVLPSAGSLDVAEASIIAIRIA